MHLQELGNLVQLDLLRIRSSGLRLLWEIFSVDGPSLSKKGVLLIHDCRRVARVQKALKANALVAALGKLEDLLG